MPRLGRLWIIVADWFKEGGFADRATDQTDAAGTKSESTYEDCVRPGRIRLRGEGQHSRMRPAAMATAHSHLRTPAPVASRGRAEPPSPLRVAPSSTR